jgi:murein DD-endopeptidase MepM/ murein hydrolase activator NlpD
MRWIVAVLLAVSLLVAPSATRAATTAAPTSFQHGYAIAPVPGGVQREFDPPPTPYAAGHRGVDLAAIEGEPVVAALGGVVTFAGEVAGVGWVTVDHGGGLDTTYGPIAPRLVVAGDQLAPGSLLGFLARGADHLDWGARLDDVYLDPLALLRRWETYLTHEDDREDAALLVAARGVAGPAISGRGLFNSPAAGPITSGFGSRRHPVTGEVRPHAGVDIGAPHGAAVRAAGAGTVSFAGTASGYGLTVIIDHGDGRTTLYAHLSRLDVQAGTEVSEGAVVGAVGATGLVTGPHLHFEVRVDGVPQDPAPLLGG